MREAIVTKEWGEVGFGSNKHEGWAWEVAFFVDGDDNPIDRHYYKTEYVATTVANLFEQGNYTTSQYGGVDIDLKVMLGLE